VTLFWRERPDRRDDADGCTSSQSRAPVARVLDGGKAVRRIARRIFAGTEPCFNMRIVVRYAGPAVRRLDAQRFQFRLERVGRLWRAIVGIHGW
jgi:hypothetical protein